MILTPVVSSNLKAVGYSSGDRLLQIEFHDSGVYQYFGVSFDVFESLMNASSKGAFFSERVKNRYRYDRIR